MPAWSVPGLQSTSYLAMRLSRATLSVSSPHFRVHDAATHERHGRAHESERDDEDAEKEGLAPDDTGHRDEARYNRVAPEGDAVEEEVGEAVHRCNPWTPRPGTRE